MRFVSMCACFNATFVSLPKDSTSAPPKSTLPCAPSPHAHAHALSAGELACVPWEGTCPLPQLATPPQRLQEVDMDLMADANGSTQKCASVRGMTTGAPETAPASAMIAACAGVGGLTISASRTPAHSTIS